MITLPTNLAFGDFVRDSVTHYKGYITEFSMDAFGGLRAFVQPRCGGKFECGVWFAIQRIEVGNRTPLRVSPANSISTKFKRGDTVYVKGSVDCVGPSFVAVTIEGRYRGIDDDDKACVECNPENALFVTLLDIEDAKEPL